jgi:hypothetical protein
MPPQDQPPAPLPPVEPAPAEAESRQRRRVRWWMIEAACAVAVLAIGFGGWWLGRQSLQGPTAANPQAAPSVSAAPNTSVAAVELDAGKNYGDKYANGLLPVGDKKYATTGAKKGSIYLCQANFVAEGQAGAQTRGPWFANNNTQYDINKKAHIAGSVSWTPSLSVKLEQGKRVITTNDLPDHKTGVFPVASNDPARAYDANPNSIKAQSLTYSLDAAPVAGKASCMSGEVGVMLTGAAIFNGFDAGGRDAGAWEVQDGCNGHPQNKGEYHYHTLSSCVTDVGVGTVLGFALDGSPITGPKVGNKNYLTTDDLDECHGLTSEIMLDGKKVKLYHYVMTQDFPYSVSCFRGTAVKAPGLPEGQSGGQGQPGGQGGAGGAPGAFTPPPRQSPPPLPGQQP